MSFGHTAEYEFRHNADRAFYILTNPSSGLSDIGNEQASLRFRDLLNQWGLLQQTQIVSFCYQRLENTNGEMLPFSRGELSRLAHAFFVSPCVQRTLRISDGKRGTINLEDAIAAAVDGTPDASTIRGVEYVEVPVTATTLQPVQAIFENPYLVRPLDAANVRESGTAERIPIPMRQCLDIFLPCGVTIADRLREYVLLDFRPLAQEAPPVNEYSENLLRAAEDTGDYSVVDAELHSGERLSAIPLQEQCEFLYHCLRRLLAGGGPICQPSTDAQLYRLAARQLYRDLIAVARARSGDPELVTQTVVLQLKRIRVKGSEDVDLDIFPSARCTDPVVYCNYNYAYLIVNYSRKEIVWWYHAFSEGF